MFYLFVHKLRSITSDKELLINIVQIYEIYRQLWCNTGQLVISPCSNENLHKKVEVCYELKRIELLTVISSSFHLKQIAEKLTLTVKCCLKEHFCIFGANAEFMYRICI